LCIIEDKAFSPSYDLVGSSPPPPLSRQKARPATHNKTENERQLAGRRVRGYGWGRSQIKRQRKSLVLYKILSVSNPLCKSAPLCLLSISMSHILLQFLLLPVFWSFSLWFASLSILPDRGQGQADCLSRQPVSPACPHSLSF
jgi:hypothetical protein